MPKHKKTKKKTTTRKIQVDTTGLAPGGRKFTMKKQLKVDRKSRADAARKRHDRVMRATGRKRLATNFGKFKGEVKKKKNK